MKAALTVLASAEHLADCWVSKLAVLMALMMVDGKDLHLEPMLVAEMALDLADRLETAKAGLTGGCWVPRRAAKRAAYLDRNLAVL